MIYLGLDFYCDFSVITDGFLFNIKIKYITKKYIEILKTTKNVHVELINFRFVEPNPFDEDRILKCLLDDDYKEVIFNCIKEHLFLKMYKLLLDMNKIII